MDRLTVHELSEAVTRLQTERNDFLELLRQVADAVVDAAPDGLTVAYLSARTVSEIRRITGH